MVKLKTKNINQNVKNIQLVVKLLNSNIEGITFKNVRGFNGQFDIILDEKSYKIGTLDFNRDTVDIYLKGAYISENFFEYGISTIHGAILQSDNFAEVIIKKIKNNLSVY